MADDIFVRSRESGWWLRSTWLPTKSRDSGTNTKVGVAPTLVETAPTNRLSTGCDRYGWYRSPRSKLAGRRAVMADAVALARTFRVRLAVQEVGAGSEELRHGLLGNGAPSRAGFARRDRGLHITPK